MSLKTTLLALLFLTGIVSLGWSQQQTIRGTVVDEQTMEPLPGATLIIPQLNVGTYTKDDGSFSLTFEPGNRTTISLVVTYTGYSRITVPVDAESFSGVREIKLIPEALSTDDVVITATKGFEQQQSDVTSSIAVVKPQSIDLQATPDMSRVINQIPGVDNQDGQINIRGSSGFAYGVGSRVMVSLDGLPLLTGDAGIAAIDMLPVDNIAQVEVLKGASSVLYGSSALGGVVNVITADAPEEPVTSIRLRGTIYGDPKNKALIYNPGDRNWAGSAHIYHSRRIGDFGLSGQINYIQDQGYRQDTEREQFRALILAKYTPKSVPGLTIGLNGTVRIDSSGQSLYWSSYFPDTLMGSDGQDSIVGGALVPDRTAGAFRRQLTTFFALDPTVKYLTSKGDLFWYRGRFLYNQAENTTAQGSRNYIAYNDFLYQKTLAKNINLVAGGTYTFSQANADSLYGGIHQGNSFGAYAQADAKFGRLNASLGFRYETVKIDTIPRESRPIFRAGLNYKIGRGTNIRASFGQAFRVPTVAERFTSTTGGGLLIEPNPNIKSEFGYSLELGARQGYKIDNSRINFIGYLDAALFQMDYDNMVEFGIDGLNLATFQGEFSTRNVANAQITGIELTTLNHFDINKWSFNLSGGVTWLDPVNQDAVPDSLQMDLSFWDPANITIVDLIRLQEQINNPEIQDAPTVLKYRPKWLIRGNVSVGYGPASLSANYRYRSFIESIDQFLFVIVQDLNTFRVDHPNGEHVLDLIANYDLNDHHTISLVVDNAFNEEFMIIPGLLAPQRRFTLQYHVRF
ncbi:TonB-dependent receptor [Pontibacter sp. G13]|uniref:TonB-dependent receptor n=1 Tax=Pontibacter sp. G13 TaxID=3074898 RepID=UPI0028891843|nr:TonB-dependent receptor [Pontibacter sp. G13]WNJ16102.1 TonB-dependent receptor [Pontibacter sp. G13]